MRDEPKTIYSCHKGTELVEAREHDKPHGGVYHTLTVGGENHATLYVHRQSDGLFILHYTCTVYYAESEDFIRLDRLLRSGRRTVVSSKDLYNLLIKILGRDCVGTTLDIISARKS